MDQEVHLAFGSSDGDQPINEDMNRMNSSPKRTTIPANIRIVVIVMATQRFDSESVEIRSEKISFPTIFSAISYDCFVVVFSDIDGGRRRSRHESGFPDHSLSKRGQSLD